MSNATVIGSGPNGLSAAITLATAGVRATVLERNTRIGGGCSTAEVTQPGFLHDLGSSTYPLGAASPFFSSLPFTIPWIQPPAAFAHPLDDGTAVMLEHSIDETIDTLDACDRKAYRSLIGPIVSNFASLPEEILGPILHIPRSPFVLALFRSTSSIAGAFFSSFPLRGKTSSSPLCRRVNPFRPSARNYRVAARWLNDVSCRAHERLAHTSWRCTSLRMPLCGIWKSRRPS